MLYFSLIFALLANTITSQSHEYDDVHLTWHDSKNRQLCPHQNDIDSISNSAKFPFPFKDKKAIQEWFIIDTMCSMFEVNDGDSYKDKYLPKNDSDDTVYCVDSDSEQDECMRSQEYTKDTAALNGWIDWQEVSFNITSFTNTSFCVQMGITAVFNLSLPGIDTNLSHSLRTHYISQKFEYSNDGILEKLNITTFNKRGAKLIKWCANQWKTVRRLIQDDADIFIWSNNLLFVFVLITIIIIVLSCFSFTSLQLTKKESVELHYVDMI